MDHVVYLDHKARELANLISGKKTMIIRGAMGRKLPYGKVNKGDTLYFIENKGDGLVKARAVAEEVFNSVQLTKQESEEFVGKHQQYLQLDPGLTKRFSGKRYLVLITVRSFETIEPFMIDRSGYANMDDWMPVGDINSIKEK